MNRINYITNFIKNIIIMSTNKNNRKPISFLALLFFLGMATGFIFHDDIQEAKDDFMRGFSGAPAKASVEVAE